jgi:protein-disulfide isomerase
MKKIAGVLFTLALLAGCDAPKTETIQQEALRAVQAHPEIIQEQVVKTIRENPELIMNILKERNVEVYQVVEKGSREMAEQKRQERIKQDLANPKKPKIDRNRPVLGSPEAPVTLVEYSDFQCFYCGKASGVIQQLVAKYPRKIQLMFKHVPLHDMSRTEALYFEAIGRQSLEKAWQFHDMAFDRREDIHKEKEAVLQEIATHLGVDETRLKQDMSSRELVDSIDEDMKEAKSFGFEATPSFLINGVSLVGAFPIEEFERIIALVEEKKPPENR